MGGSQINAIELAAAIRDRGNEVIIYAPAGELSQKISNLGLKLVLSPSGIELSLAWARGLRLLAQEFDPDIVHTYEWAPSMNAACGFRSIRNACQVITVLSMDVPKFLPTHLHLTVGTRQLAESMKRNIAVHVIEPPIDTQANRTVDLCTARRQIRASNEEFVVSIICRMTNELDKANGVLNAIEAIEYLAQYMSIRLLVVGDGPELTRISNQADAVNTKLGRTVIEITGSVLDPGVFYEGSDVVLGMGSSILRGMAYGKPVVVQGSDGYWELLTPDTLDTFLDVGFFGNGGAGASALLSILKDLVSNPATNSSLGSWNRELVESKFSLVSAADRLERIYKDAQFEPRRKGAILLSILRSIAGLTKFRMLKMTKSLKDRAAI